MREGVSKCDDVVDFPLHSLESNALEKTKDPTPISINPVPMVSVLPYLRGNTTKSTARIHIHVNRSTVARNHDTYAVCLFNVEVDDDRFIVMHKAATTTSIEPYSVPWEDEDIVHASIIGTITQRNSTTLGHFFFNSSNLDSTTPYNNTPACLCVENGGLRSLEKNK